MKLRCRLGWHRWTKWEQIGGGLLLAERLIDRADLKPEQKAIGRYIHLRRECADCNLIQLRDEDS